METRVLKRAGTSGRADDNTEALKKRFIHFETYEKLMTEEFRKLDKLVTVMPCSYSAIKVIIRSIAINRLKRSM